MPETMTLGLEELGGHGRRRRHRDRHGWRRTGHRCRPLPHADGPTLFLLPFQCLQAAAPAVGYQDLRLHREGADVDDLVRVFE